MRVVSAYYWRGGRLRVRDKMRVFLRGAPPPPGRFKYGNAGDIFNIDLMHYLYGAELELVSESDRASILSVGSVIHRASHMSIVCGAGAKSEDAHVDRKAKIIGVRGPLTLGLLGAKEDRVGDRIFIGDPGLLAPEVYKNELANLGRPGHGPPIFIPHFRTPRSEVNAWSKYCEVVSVDAKPLNLIKRIANSGRVYSSSLHGIIFSDSLDIDCIPVEPPFSEGRFKYYDYFESVGRPKIFVPSPEPPVGKIRVARPRCASLVSAADFPSFKDLIQWGVAYEANQIARWG